MHGTWRKPRQYQAAQGSWAQKTVPSIGKPGVYADPLFKGEHLRYWFESIHSILQKRYLNQHPRRLGHPATHDDAEGKSTPPSPSFLRTSMPPSTHQLPPLELSQQVDVSMRLLRMALYGVPTNTLTSLEEQQTMALQALMTAFMALAKTSSPTRKAALSQLIEANIALTSESDRREGRTSEPPIKVFIG